MIRLAVRCSPEQAELVLAELTVLAPNGVEESRGAGFVEYAIYGGEGELPELGEIDAAVGDGRVEVTATEVADDWADRWREFHRPVLVGGRVWLRPPWAEQREGAVDVVVDPGRAFGTGAHPTTRLCLELLLELNDRGEGGALTDLGTGSGVLAIAAAKLGWAPVRGYDHDPAALDAAAENAHDNDVDLELERLDLRTRLPSLSAVVVANLTAPMLVGIAAELEKRVGRSEGVRRSVPNAAPDDPSGPPRTLVCSGLLVGEQDEVSAAFAAAGFREEQRRSDGDWAALLMRRS